MTYKGVDIGNQPTLEMIAEYISTMHFKLDPVSLYNKYNSRQWMTIKKTPIKSVEAIVNAENSIKHNEVKVRIPKPPEYNINLSRQDNYTLFLNSEYWKYVRSLKLAQAHDKCQVCGCHYNLIVHHNSYEHHKSEHEHLEDLVVLCKNCHNLFHNHTKTLQL